MGYKEINARIFCPDDKKAYCEIITCDAADSCELYAKGCCVQDGFFLLKVICPHQRINYEYGYTKRAAKYNAWLESIRYQYKDIHNALKLSYSKLAIVGGDYVFLPYPHLKTYRSSLSENLVNDKFIPIENFDIDFIERIYSFRPLALDGGEISSYQNKYMPLFFKHLKELMPEKLNEFIEKYPESEEALSHYIRNHIGRTAYIYTLKDGSVLRDAHKYEWKIVGDELVCKENRMSLIPWVQKTPTTVKIKIQKDMVYEITNNDMVTGDTIFVD